MTSNSFKLNRFLASPLTAILLKTPVTPNQVTLISLFFGILTGLCFSTGNSQYYLLGALLFQLAAILDNCDGDVARAKNMRSEFGGWLDVVVDVLVDFALFIGLALGVSKNYPGSPAVLFGVLCVAGSFINFGVVIIEKMKGFGPAVFNQSNPKDSGRDNVFFKIADALREGDSSWFLLIFVLIGKTDYLLWFSGIYMQILWLSSLLMNFKWIMNPRKLNEDR